MDHIQFLNNPDEWSYYPYLPVKKNGQCDNFSKDAIVLSKNGKLKLAEGFNIFALSNGMQKIQPF